MGGNELLSSLANPLLHLADPVSRDAARLSRLIYLIICRLHNGVDHVLGRDVVSGCHLGQGLQVGAVLADRVGPLGQLGRAGALQQHRVGEPLHPMCWHAGRRGDLLDGLTRTDAGLDLSGAHLALQLDFDLAESGDVAPGGRTEAFVRWHDETLAARDVLANDGLAVFAEADRCDRLLLMREGALIADETPDDLRAATGVQNLEEAFLELVLAQTGESATAGSALTAGA